MIVDRLNSTDEMLFSSGQDLGSWRIVQVLWRFSERVPHAALREEWDRLDQTRLSRVAADPCVPAARRRWIGARNRQALPDCAELRSAEELMAWIDLQVRAPLPVESDALWRLAAAGYRQGSVVSLTVPHFRSDGMGLFAAVHSRPRAHARRAVPGLGLLAADVADALGQVVLAAGGSAPWAVRFLCDRRRRSRVRSALRGSPGPPPLPGRSEPRFFSSAIFQLDAEAWNRRAAEHGGTANTLFIEVAANLVRACIERAAINVGVPVSLRRSSDDGRANALVVIPLTVPGGAPQHEELRSTRQVARAALQCPEAREVTLVPEPLWHLLPRRLADRLKVPGAQQTDVVASNFARPPEGVIEFAGQRADSVALRTMNVPGVVPERARLRASLCLVEVDGAMTLTATGMPDDFGGADRLKRLVIDECRSWGLQARPWC